MPTSPAAHLVALTTATVLARAVSAPVDALTVLAVSVPSGRLAGVLGRTQGDREGRLGVQRGATLQNVPGLVEHSRVFASRLRGALCGIPTV